MLSWGRCVLCVMVMEVMVVVVVVVVVVHAQLTLALYRFRPAGLVRANAAGSATGHAAIARGCSPIRPTAAVTNARTWASSRSPVTSAASVSHRATIASVTRVRCTVRVQPRAALAAALHKPRQPQRPSFDRNPTCAGFAWQYE